MGVDARMYVTVPERPTDDQIARWSWDVAEAIGSKPFWLDADIGRRALEWCEDEWVAHAPCLSVSLMGRYYGVGYERGDILAYRAIAEWCEQNIPGAKVFYGGDSSDNTVEFNASERKRLVAHLYGPEGRRYYRYDKRGSFPTPPPCSLCVPGENRFDRFGWGNSFVAVSCGSCDRQWESRDNGLTWSERKE